MRALGYVEGKSLMGEWRFADSKVERRPGLAAEFVRMQVNVLVAAARAAALAMEKTTTTIPIVMTTAADPGAGLVKSPARPGSNTTGVVNLDGDLGASRLIVLVQSLFQQQEH